MAIDSVNSTAPVITGAVLGAVAGGTAVWKGAPVIAKQFAEARDVYIGQAVDKNFDKLLEGGITNEHQITKIMKRVVDKARTDFKNSHKITNSIIEFTQTHKKSAIAIGAAALAVVGGLIGKAVANKKAEKVEQQIKQ